jgi:hypothetical protein
MVIRLLPAPAEAQETKEVSAASTSLASNSPLTVTTRVRTSGAGKADDSYVWSTPAPNSARPASTKSLPAAQSGEVSSNTDEADWGYVSGYSRSTNQTLTPAAHYLNYSGSSSYETGQLVDVYA